MDHRNQFDLLREQEKSNTIARDQWLEGLLKTLDELSRNRDDLKRRLDRSDVVLLNYEREAAAMKIELTELKKNISNDPFVSILIDGDVTLFKDDYIRRGRAGGEDAARDLQTAVENHLKSLDIGFESHWKINIRVYSKLSGLSKTYVKCGIVKPESIFWSYVEGFNAASQLCEYVDAGMDKEGADNKLKGNLSMMYRNVHCRHIMLGISGDNSYTGPLRQYTLTDSKNKHITLIESTPFPADLRTVAEKFPTTTFATIFRSSPLVVPPAAPAPAPTSFATAAAKTSLPYYTAVASRSPVLSNVVNSPVVIRQNGSSQAESKLNSHKQIKIGVNRQGHRVDLKLPRVDWTTFMQLKDKKLCNRHYLSRCDNAYCAYDHETKLSAKEIEALKHVARLSPCENITCRDPQCVSAHRCPKANDCTYGTACKFRREMHNNDTDIHNTVMVDVPE